MRGTFSLLAVVLFVSSACVPFGAEVNNDGTSLAEAAAKGGYKGKPNVTPAPTAAPTAAPIVTPRPTLAPTVAPQPTAAPTVAPQPTVAPTAAPTPAGVAVTYVYLSDQSVAVGGSVLVAITQITPSNATATDLIWSTSSASSTIPGLAGGDLVTGKVSTTGVYTPPANPLIGADVYKVWAVSKANSSIRDFGFITVVGSAPVVTPAPTVAPAPAGVVPAFPGAQGGGALSKGGRGGRVIEVTTLSDAASAPAGSLRACVEATGARTCVFRVGGTISLQVPLIINNPYLTVAGQTAPGGGIQLSGKAMPLAANGPADLLDIRTHDITWRYTRLRRGYNANTPDQGGDTVVIRPGSYNLILDHNSVAWTQDENIDIGAWSSGTPPKSITLSWNIVAEPLAAHPTTLGIGASTREANDLITDIDIHHNYFPNTSHRNPLVANKRLRWINNILYNYQYYANQLEGGVFADIINNIYKSGPMGGGDPGQDHEIQSYPTGYPNTASGAPSLYVVGNKGPNNPDPLADNWNSMVRQVASENGMEVGLLSTQYRRTTPLPASGVQITPDATATLDSRMLPTVGASQRLDCNGSWVAVRDAADTRVVNDYYNMTGTIPASETSVGGFPAIAAGTACADADHDGMPDAFETARGLNPASASDGNIVGADGFTNLERYLNGI